MGADAAQCLTIPTVGNATTTPGGAVYSAAGYQVARVPYQFSNRGVRIGRREMPCFMDNPLIWVLPCQKTFYEVDESLSSWWTAGRTAGLNLLNLLKTVVWQGHCFLLDIV